MDKVLQKKHLKVFLDVFFPLVWKKYLMKSQKAQILKTGRCMKKNGVFSSSLSP